MAHRWQDAEPLLVDAAVQDLGEVGEVEPAMVAFAGSLLRFVAWLRPFAPGEHHDPVIEVLALAGPLDCDRLMLSLGGRVWTLEQPPAVDGDGDRRQRAIVIEAVDAADGPLRSWTALHPFTLDGGVPTLGSRCQPQTARGWVGEALLAAVRHRERLRAPPAAIAAQAARLDALGHVLHLPPDVVSLLARR